jgi:hypothetical protein
MKYIQDFESYVNEFNYGNELFADPDADLAFIPHALIRLMNKLGINPEANTKEENLVMRNIAKYKSNEKQASNLGKYLKEILHLKDKYPGFLDPAKDPFISNDGYVYRGTSIDTIQLIKFIEKANVNWKTNKKGDYLIIPLNSELIKERSRNGYMSFTLSESVAQAFCEAHPLIESEMSKLNKNYPVIFKCNINKMSDKLILSPSFMNVFRFAEAETLYLSDTFVCDEIQVLDPNRMVDLGTSDSIIEYINSPGYKEYPIPKILLEFLKVSQYI